MRNPNPFARELRPEEIARGAHRNLVGGMWDELGRLQLDFLRQEGLAPADRLLDVGCGCLRGGVHFVRFLNAGKYYGLDLSRSLIEAGYKELDAAGLSGKGANLLVNDCFEFSRFGVEFEFLFAQSVLTHLSWNQVSRCFVEARKVLAAGGRFYATFFEAPDSAHLEPILHEPGGVVTNLDADPYHASFEEMRMLAENAGLSAALLGDWRHPRGQRMLRFEVP
jgi:ubiquinone/menaquinone biosynthesis C-methylase UbiE